MSKTICTFILTCLLCSCVSIEEPQTYDLTAKQMEFASRGLDFDCSFIRSIADSQEKDWFVSPLGLHMMLGMLANGATGETKEQILKVLGYKEDELDEVNGYYKTIMLQLPEYDSKAKLCLANSAFFDNSFSIKPPFEDCIEKNYLATVKRFDFSKSNSYNKVNDWCRKSTSGLIPKIIEGPADQLKFIILNALSFNGEWTEKFSKKDSGSEPFHLESGSEKEMIMMKLKKQDARAFIYSENELCEVLQIPFGNKSFAMSIILPKQGNTLRKTIEHLTPSEWISLSGAVSEVGEIDLWLPRFSITCNVELNAVLSRMGMPLAFEDGDFSAIDNRLKTVSLIKQANVIEVNEDGAKASSATAAIGFGAIPRNIVFHADHPFLFLITESHSGSILFAGAFTGN